MSIVDQIFEEVKLAEVKEPVNKCIVERKNIVNTNEFLFIIKPEVFAKVNDETTLKALNIIVDQIAAFDISIDKIRILNASYLKEYSVMDQHYGLINTASRNVDSVITSEVEANFKASFGEDIKQVSIIGSLEVARKYPEMSDETLAKLWSNADTKRLASGVYAGKADYNGETIYIVNGFHPPQLKHFTDENRVIVTMDLSTKVGWQKARNKFIGSTYPEKAKEGSLRKKLFDLFDQFGFDDISYLINSVHLSAGPVEGLVELTRFNTDFRVSNEENNTDYVFAEMLKESFTPVVTERILNNAPVVYNEEITSTFDVTEEVDSLKAIDILKNVRFNQK